MPATSAGMTVERWFDFIGTRSNYSNEVFAPLVALVVRKFRCVLTAIDIVLRSDGACLS
jgi:hypothetical protein